MRTILLFFILLISLAAAAQITTPIVKANFGVDADLRANVLNGVVTGGGDDWFKDATLGTGRNVIDTTGAAAIVAGYNSDASPWPKRMSSFFRGMSVPTFTIVNNRLWLDAMYVRDYHGTDTTVFVVSSKNGESPAVWNGGIQNIPDKNDILDVMTHVRRAGPNPTDSLWLFGGISMDNINGDRYFDFELYQTDIYYDRVSQKFYGYGPDAGHTSWKFDATGKVIQPGDIILTGAFQSNSLTTIEARIWVSNSDWQTVSPTAFNWSGQFDGASSGATYGYASIAPNTAGAFYTGLGNPSNTWPGPFNLVLQSNALQFTNPAPASTTNGKYIPDQFIEFSVNLTKLGLDPVTTFGTDVCGTPFNRLMVKTRSSASFTADLKDFVAPTDLFLAPRAEIAADIPVFCDTQAVSHLQITDPSSSSDYTWSTIGGHIVGPNTGTAIVVDSPGTYIVTQRLSAGCNPYAYDTLNIIFDKNCSILDINNLIFKGTVTNEVTKLNWTIDENNVVSYFDVERSFDGKLFNFISRVNPDPTISSQANYSVLDDLSHVSAPPTIYYRLKIKKRDGTVVYSKIISIPFSSGITHVSVSPNPAHDVVQVTINTSSRNSIDLYVYDMLGKAIRKIHGEVEAGVNVISVNDLSWLQSGMYIIVVSTGGQTFRQKVVLAK